MKKLLLLSFLFSSIYSFGQVPTNGLVAWYKFDNNVNDSSGNNLDATRLGATFVADRFGNANSAIDFDGNNDQVKLPLNPLLQPSYPMTISFWVKYDSSSVNDRAVFDLCDETDRTAGVWFNSSASTGTYAVNIGDGSYVFNSTSRRTFISNAVITNSVWTHITIVLTGYYNMQIYENCVLTSGISGGSGGSLFYNPNVAGVIGRHDRIINYNHDYFDGQIDDFMIWNRDLSVAEIAQVCGSTASVEDAKDVTFINFETLNDKLEFSNTESLSEYNIYDLSGRLVLNSNNFETRYLNEMSNGIYIIQLMNVNGNVVERKKIII